MNLEIDTMYYCGKHNRIKAGAGKRQGEYVFLFCPDCLREDYLAGRIAFGRTEQEARQNLIERGKE